MAGHSSGSLDLEREDGAVVAIDDEIYLVSVTGSPVPNTGNPIQPGCLFE